MALVTMLRMARWRPSGSNRMEGTSAGLPVEGDAEFGGAGLHELDDVGDGFVERGDFEGGLAVLGEGEHVHDQVVDLGLVFLDDGPASADDGVVLFVEAHVDEVASAAEALEDVLDVVR